MRRIAGIRRILRYRASERLNSAALRREGASMKLSEQLGKDRLIWMWTQMIRIREFEERVKRTFVEHPGVIRGHTHLGDGAEASIVGSLATRNGGDPVMPSYRCHGYPIVLGTSPR